MRIGQSADLVVVAPATADMLAKAAHGLADDLLTNTLLTARCPVVFAPAMHTEMWEHPATQENVATLRRRGAVVIEPAVGRLTGVDTGKGRLPDPTEIFEVCRHVLRRHSLARGVTEPDLKGRTSSSARAAPASPRPGPLPRQPLLGQAGLRPRAHRRRPGRPGHPDRGEHRTAGPGGRRRRAGRDRRTAAGGGAEGRRGRGRGRHGRGGRGLPPGGVRGGEDQEEGRQGTRPHRPGAESGHPRGDLRRPRPRRTDRRRIRRRRDGRRPRQRPYQTGTQGMRSPRGERGGERKTFGSEENEAVVLGADGSETAVPTVRRKPWPRRCGTWWRSGSPDLFQPLVDSPKPDIGAWRLWPTAHAIRQNARAAGHSVSREARQGDRLSTATDKLFSDDVGRSSRPVRQ